MFRPGCAGLQVVPFWRGHPTLRRHSLFSVGRFAHKPPICTLLRCNFSVTGGDGSMYFARDRIALLLSGRGQVV